MTITKTKWEDAKLHLKTIRSQYLALPLSSSWFALSQIRDMEARLEKGERTEQLFNEIMSME